MYLQLLIFLLFWFISGAFIVLWMTYKKKEKPETNLQAFDQTFKEQEISAAYAQLKEQSKERELIAQNLHDQIGSLLSTAKIYLEVIDLKVDSIQLENTNQLEKATQLLDDACNEVRKISEQVQSGISPIPSVTNHIDHLINWVNQTQPVNAHFIHYGLKVQLPYSVQVKVYRIVSDLVFHTLNHAFATQLVVQLNQFEQIINLIIEDNGTGLTNLDPEVDQSNNLKQVKKMIQNLGGHLDVDSKPKRGTIISIDFSLKQLLIKNSKNSCAHNHSHEY